MDVFLDNSDRLAYLNILRKNSIKYGIRLTAYCLMNNHIHLIVIPGKEDSIARAVGETHRLYTLKTNERSGTSGYLFQGRFFSCPMDIPHAINAAAYIEKNPVRAGIVSVPWEYEWSSAGFHCGLTKKNSLLSGDVFWRNPTEWRKIISQKNFPCSILKQNTKTGRPLGSEDFIDRAEIITGRILRKRKPGPKLSIMSPN